MADPGQAHPFQAFPRRGLLRALPAAALAEGLTVQQMLVQSGLAASGKEAKRLIAEGGLRLDNRQVDDPQAALGDIGEGIKVSIGRKKHRMLRPA